jgi:hypothetical protein
VVAWPITIEAEITPHSLPPATAPTPDSLALARVAARNEIATLCLALRSGEAQGPCPVQFKWSNAPTALTADVMQVWYNTSRDFNTIAYQFFDLDGREPDTAMICYGRHGLYTTIQFERCREGAQDFYLYNTLSKAVERTRQQGRKDTAVATAEALLAQLNASHAPDTTDLDKLKADILAAVEALTTFR